MALELYMLGLIVQDMGRSLELNSIGGLVLPSPKAAKQRPTLRSRWGTG